MKSKIFLYSNLTVIFFILTIISIGGISSSLPLIQVIVNISLFALLTINCATKEATLRSQYSRKLKRRASVNIPAMQVYASNGRKNVA